MNELEYDNSDGLSVYDGSLHAACLAVTILLVGMLIAFAVRPLRGASRELSQEIRSAEEFLQQRPRIESRHQELVQALAEQHRLHADLMAHIPAAARESEFLAQLTELSRSAGMTISRYSPGVIAHHSRYDSLDIDLTARASYESLCRFLCGLESLPRLCHIIHLDIASPDVHEPTFPVEMTVRIFFSPATESPDPAPVSNASLPNRHIRKSSRHRHTESLRKSGLADVSTPIHEMCGEGPRIACVRET